MQWNDLNGSHAKRPFVTGLWASGLLETEEALERSARAKTVLSQGEETITVEAVTARGSDYFRFCPSASRNRVASAVQPVWWLAPTPRPVSPWKYS